MNLDKAARIAEKRNARLRAEVPLFADQAELVTAEQVQAAFDRHAEKFKRCWQELQRRGDTFREQVQQLVTAEQLHALDQRRAILPPSPEYHANFWREQWEQHRLS